MLLAVLASGDDVVVILVGGLGGEEAGEFAGERIGLGLPGLLGRGALVLGRGGFLAVFLQPLDPAGFLPICCGRFPQDSVVDVYQNSPVFTALRNPELLKGRCGKCKFHSVCGGSRSRAYAVTGDFLAEEPTVLLGDDLYAHTPFCRKVSAAKAHFLFTCKRPSHKALYEYVDDFGPDSPLMGRVVGFGDDGRGHQVVWTVRYANDVPLTDEDKALLRRYGAIVD